MNFTTRCIIEKYIFLILDNVYQPSRCQEILEEIRKCCIKHSSISTVCDGIDTSKRYEHNTVDYVSSIYILIKYTVLFTIKEKELNIIIF